MHLACPTVLRQFPGVSAVAAPRGTWSLKQHEKQCGLMITNKGHRRLNERTVVVCIQREVRQRKLVLFRGGSVDASLRESLNAAQITVCPKRVEQKY